MFQALIGKQMGRFGGRAY